MISPRKPLYNKASNAVKYGNKMPRGNRGAAGLISSDDHLEGTAGALACDNSLQG